MPACSLVKSWAGLILLLLAAIPAWPSPDPAEEGASPPALVGNPKVFARFREDIYPMLTRNEGDSCVSCHDPDTRSDLVFLGNPIDDFLMLRENGYFALEGPDTLLDRLTSTNPKKRMPKGKHASPWTTEEVGKLRAFLAELKEADPNAQPVDEAFPASLLRPYLGPVPDVRDNQFITYSQLRGKIRTIFQDEGDRATTNLFQENLALFGGADFKERFDETSQPSSSFLTALDLVGKDVAIRAYEAGNGPFRKWPESLPSPAKEPEPDPAYHEAITRLFQAVLFRPPLGTEMHDAFALLQSVYLEKETIARSDYELGFKVTATDPATGLQASREISIPVRGGRLAVYQELVDQSAGEPGEGKKAKPRKGFLARPLFLKRDEAGQRLLLHNVGTFENVSFAGLELSTVDGEVVFHLDASDPKVKPEGAWKLTERNGFSSYEDDNLEKGRSRILVPLEVPADGTYEVALLWRSDDFPATNVFVEVFGPEDRRLAQPVPAAVPAQGEARFFYDSREDTVAYADLEAAFQFGEKDYVEINNTGTRKRVTAGALDFVPRQGGPGFTVDSREAEGQEPWQNFDEGQFKAYNREGTQVNDENKRKGELFLRYRPSSKKQTESKAGWEPERFYDVHIHYPGKSGNEPRTPVVVKARASSPILQLAYPPLAACDASLEIDASASYTVQRSGLKFAWSQTRGVPVRMQAEGPILKCFVPRRSVEEGAWVALTRALLRHPDFLFARPPSIFQVRDQALRKRLQLVKIALDLVGRPPNATELTQLADGASLGEEVDRYLDSAEFREFYERRIRLYLESHGTELQDEPVRLWCYVAFHDLPFQDILTADYTVDVNFQKNPRPDYHGRTGLLTTKGFIEGKPGLPHYNYAAQVSMLFLGYIYEVPPEIVEQREGATALGTTDPNSVCYSCHKILTPLAFQRSRWSDDGVYRARDERGQEIDQSDQGMVREYPFRGAGMEAFATQAVKKERFIRTMINTHFNFYFGRPLRHRTDERGLYKRLWDEVHADHFTIRGLIRAIVASPEYLEGRPPG
jgi:hypothetical protein